MTAGQTVRCLHCRGEYATASLKARGLCRWCYADADIRGDYPFRRRGGWPAGSRAWTPDELAFLLDAHDQGIPREAVATQLGRTVGSVRKALVRYASEAWTGCEARA